MSKIQFSGIFVALFFVRCTTSTENLQIATKPKVQEVHSIKELSVDFAQNFTITPVNGGYDLEFIDPNSQEVESRYFLRYRILRDSLEATDKKRTIELPVGRISSLSQTSVGMLCILNARDQLSGISDIRYLWDEEIRELWEDGEIMEIGEESNFQIEKIVQSASNVLLYNGFGRNFPQENKLQTMGVHALPNYDWREAHPLGKAEWIKLIGILCGKEREALDYFESIQKEYEALKWSVRSAEYRPTVMSGNLIGDIWYTPAGQSYLATLFNDAQAEYMYGHIPGTGSIERTLEEILRDNVSTEFWINPNISSKSALSMLNPKAKFLHPFENGTYGYSHNTNLFWERSAAEPHHVLSDLIHIFHPEISQATELYFYRKLND